MEPEDREVRVAALIAHYQLIKNDPQTVIESVGKFTLLRQKIESLANR